MRRLAPIFCLLTLPAMAQDNPIAGRMAAFAAAYNAGDADAVAGFYGRDGALLSPMSAALIGREAIAAHYKAAFDGGVTNLRYEIREIRGHGERSAVEIGETLVDLNGQTIHGRYLHVWVLGEAGWQLSRDIYHVLAVRESG